MPSDNTPNAGNNGTFTKPTMTSGSQNLTFGQNNATFDISHNATFEVIRNHSQDNDDRLSSTSDSSVSHRLNDLGDVQHLARMQEESELNFYNIAFSLTICRFL